MNDNPFSRGDRVQFRNVNVRRDNPELRTGTVTATRHHVVDVTWDAPRAGTDAVAGAYHWTSLVEIGEHP